MCLQVESAVAAAKAAFPDWSSRSPLQRAQVLNKLADLIEANLEEFAQAESKDQGFFFILFNHMVYKVQCGSHNQSGSQKLLVVSKVLNPQTPVCLFSQLLSHFINVV